MKQISSVAAFSALAMALLAGNAHAQFIYSPSGIPAWPVEGVGTSGYADYGKWGVYTGYPPATPRAWVRSCGLPLAVTLPPSDGLTRPQK